MPLEALPYVAYADRFGWLPDQVDDLPMWLEPWILPIHDVMNDIRDKRSGAPGPGGTTRSAGDIDLTRALPPPEDDET